MRGIDLVAAVDVPGRDWRSVALREPAPIDGLSWPRSVREIDRRKRQARRHHQGRQHPGTTACWSRPRGATAIPPRVGKEKQTRIGAAPRTAREIAWKAQMRLCGALPGTDAEGQEADARGNCDRARAVSLHLGRSAARSRISCNGEPVDRAWTARAVKGSTGPLSTAHGRNQRASPNIIVQQRGRGHGRGTPDRHYVADRKIDARV